MPNSGEEQKREKHGDNSVEIEMEQDEATTSRPPSPPSSWSTRMKVVIAFMLGAVFGIFAFFNADYMPSFLSARTPSPTPSLPPPSLALPLPGVRECINMTGAKPSTSIAPGQTSRGREREEREEGKGKGGKPPCRYVWEVMDGEWVRVRSVSKHADGVKELFLSVYNQAGYEHAWVKWREPWLWRPRHCVLQWKTQQEWQDVMNREGLAVFLLGDSVIRGLTATMMRLVTGTADDTESRQLFHSGKAYTHNYVSCVWTPGLLPSSHMIDTSRRDSVERFRKKHDEQENVITAIRAFREWKKSRQVRRHVVVAGANIWDEFWNPATALEDTETVMQSLEEGLADTPINVMYRSALFVDPPPSSSSSSLGSPFSKWSSVHIHDAVVEGIARRYKKSFLNLRQLFIDVPKEVVWGRDGHFHCSDVSMNESREAKLGCKKGNGVGTLSRLVGNILLNVAVGELTA